MSYEPLHHKYRPQTFADLVGQEAIATTLTNAIRTSKIAPAYLFTGPRGTGKTSSARILAKSLNCLKSDKPSEQPCGVCDVCKGIANGSTLDVIEIDAASNTGVDNIREIIERAQFAPVQCRYKVYSIDECHMLSIAAFNALLKTLEEPPSRVVFVLATTDPQRVLPTIISRCQRFDFRRIAIEAMVNHLSAIASKESINIEREALTLIAQVSQGGLRDAESLLDQLSLLSGQITVERVWDLVGSCSEPDLIALLQAIAQNHPESVLDRARSLMDRGREPLTVLQNLAGFYRDLLIAKTAPERNDLVAVTPSTWTQMCDLALSWDISTILKGQHHLKDSEVQIKNTTQPRLWLEVTLLGLLPAANIAQPTAISSQPLGNIVRQRSEPIPQPTTAQQPPTPPSSPAQSRQDACATPASSASPAPQHPITPSPHHPITPSPQPTKADIPIDTPREQIWQQVLANLQPISTRELLRQMCRLIEFDGASARIGITSQPWYKKTQAHLPNITAAFLETFKREVQVSLELLTPNKTNTASAQERQTPATGIAPAKSSPMAPIANHRAAASSSQVAAHTQFQAETKQDRSTRAKVSEAPKSEVATYTPTEQTHRSTPTADWEDDEAAIAAQRLADFFNGEVVRLNLDIAFAHGAEANNPPSIVKPTEDWNELDTEEEDDMEF